MLPLKLDRKPNPYLIVVGFFLLALIQAFVLLVTQSTENETVSKPIERKVYPTPADPIEDPWSLFHPAWKNEKWLELSTYDYDGNDILWKNTPIVIEELINDPDQKIEAEFRPTEELATRVSFWVSVYSRFSSRIRVIHDRDNPSIVYGYIDLRPLYRTADNNQIAFSRCQDFERKILKRLKQKLMATISNTADLGVDEKNEIHGFLSKIGALSRAEVEALLARTRSQTGQADVFIEAIRRSRQLLPHIETVLKKQEIPVALARIPFVESSFNPRAYSKSGAMGIWQFMPETASQMISKRSQQYWSDPLKQTQSAAKLLKFYRSLVPDWGIAITAYNSGIGRMRSLVQKHKAKGITDLLKLNGKNGLGFAGENFYAEFLAANLVEAYKERLFDKLLTIDDVSLVLRGLNPFPKDSCDL